MINRKTYKVSKRDLSKQTGSVISVPKDYFGAHPSFKTKEFAWTPVGPKNLKHYEDRGYSFPPAIRNNICLTKGRPRVSKFIRVRTLDLPSGSRTKISTICSGEKCTNVLIKPISSLKLTMLLCERCKNQYTASKRMVSKDALEDLYKIKFIDRKPYSTPSIFVTEEGIAAAEVESKTPIRNQWGRLKQKKKLKLLRRYIIRQSIASIKQNGIASSAASRRQRWQATYDFIKNDLNGVEKRFKNSSGKNRAIDCFTDKYVIEIKENLGRMGNFESGREIQAILDYKDFAHQTDREFFVLVNCAREELPDGVPNYFLSREDWGRVGVSKVTITVCADIKKNPDKYILKKPRSKEQESIVRAIKLHCESARYFPTHDQLVEICEAEFGVTYSINKICAAVDPLFSYLTASEMREKLGVTCPVKGAGSGLKHKHAVFELKGNFYTAKDLIALVSKGSWSDWLQSHIKSVRKTDVEEFKLPVEEEIVIKKRPNPFNLNVRGKQIYRDITLSLAHNGAIVFEGKNYTINEFSKLIVSNKSVLPVEKLIDSSKRKKPIVVPVADYLLEPGRKNIFRKSTWGKTVRKIGHGSYSCHSSGPMTKHGLVRITGVTYETILNFLRSEGGKSFTIPNSYTLTTKVRNPFKYKFRGKYFHFIPHAELPRYKIGKEIITSESKLLDALGITKPQLTGYFKKGSNVFIVPVDQVIVTMTLGNPIKKIFRGEIVRIVKS